MKLTVLGHYGPFPAPGGACSGYLLECGDAAIVMDLGSGALANLRRIKPELKLDAVLLTHLHSDHMADMLVLRYALEQFNARRMDVNVPLTVVAPDKPEAEYHQLAASGVFEMLPAREGQRIRISGVTIAMYGTVHPVKTVAYDVEYKGKRIFYTGDTGYYFDLPTQCAGADILLADACFLNADKPSAIAPHLTAGEAGLIAREAGVKQLICTHAWGGADQANEMLAEAREHFPNSLVAEDMHEYYA